MGDLPFMALDSGRGGRDSMLGAYEPPVYWSTAYDSNEMDQYTEMNSGDAGGWVGAFGSIMGVQNRNVSSGGGSRFTQSTEGLRSSRYARKENMSNPNEDLLKASLGGNIML